jgi:hypothetical protein
MNVLEGKLRINDCVVVVMPSKKEIHAPMVWEPEGEPFDIEEHKLQDEKKYEAMRIYNETFHKI